MSESPAPGSSVTEQLATDVWASPGKPRITKNNKRWPFKALSFGTVCYTPIDNNLKERDTNEGVLHITVLCKKQSQQRTCLQMHRYREYS